MPDWSQTYFPAIPTSLLLRNAQNHTVIRPSHTWTQFRIQARSAYRTPSAFTASLLWFPLLIPGNDPHNGFAPVIPEPLLLRAGWTMTTPQSPREQALFSTSLLLLQPAESPKGTSALKDGCRDHARQCRGRWCSGKQNHLLFTTLPTKVWNKISSCLKSRAAVPLRMIRHATELYHGNYIRNKFTIWERRKITRSNPPKQLQCHSWEICREEKCITQEQLRMNSRWEGLGVCS